ncbi:MAG: 2-octaprenyl-3-methyl-6-methoxy-1,4-benzoquinol hydroxylase [marine bacterium B5-7]|nr:MAG: 2-octaprenyl-3-methyl-6-methoxy-1,4-benzoquinol hydroxylase [marine bacterium B5-7]
MDVDIAVIGGGIAGSIAALACARAGFTTTLIDNAAISMPGNEYETRVSSINLRSEEYLQQLEAWDIITRYRTSPFDRIEVWTESQQQPLTFDAADAGLDHFGHILENNLLAAAARRQLEINDNYRQSSESRVESLAIKPDAAELNLSTGYTIRTQLVVAADGANSIIRKLSGINRSLFDYRQRAIVARVLCEQHHGLRARQKFLETGPLAFLPLADGSCSIVWSMDNDHVDEILKLDDQDFCERLGEVFEHRLGAIETVMNRASFALRRSHATRYYAERVVLVGDAGHTIHPLAGLGANLGIADVHALVETLIEARRARQSFWGSRVLSRYQRRRRAINSITLSAMDVFHVGFANNLPILSTLRGRFLSIIDKSDTAKRFFIEQAGGSTP